MPGTLTGVRSESRVAQLMALAVEGLGPMYDPEKKLFCYKLKQTAAGMAREGISPRYTIMTVLGLLRAESVGLRSPISIADTLDALFSTTSWVDNIGDLGLLLWLCAVASPERLARFAASFDLEHALDRYPDGRNRLTMEMSWFLTGLVHASEAQENLNLQGLAREIYGRLRANQGDHGIFGHMARWSSLAGVARGRVGSFADQVYPTYAMSHFARVFDDKEASRNALRCAKAICNLQGPLGQWWWHYNSVSGRVVEQYPVYSVHQHGMAPMALFAAQEVCKADFSARVYKGLEWVSGANELQTDLEDRSSSLIWRCIRPLKSGLFGARVRTLLGTEQNTGAMEVLYECRPYELGWLLFAHAQLGSTATSA
jgi:hypothetical protein